VRLRWGLFFHFERSASVRRSPRKRFDRNDLLRALTERKAAFAAAFRTSRSATTDQAAAFDSATLSRLRL
jgi:hypothetical protein